MNKFSLKLVDAGPSRLPIVKIAKEELHLGLKEAKDLVFKEAPCVLSNDLSKSEADRICALLEEWGATAEVVQI